MPVYFNPATKEPYLRLAAPHSNIIITPHRLDQIEDEIAPRVEMLNDPKIYLHLEGPPVPYRREDAESWVKTKGEELLPVVEALQSNPTDPGVFGKSPFCCIRDVTRHSTDGHPLEDVLIGDISIDRYMFYEYPEGSEERTVAQNFNRKLPAGDESIAWGIGCSYLKENYHDFLSGD